MSIQELLLHLSPVPLPFPVEDRYQELVDGMERFSLPSNQFGITGHVQITWQNMSSRKKSYVLYVPDREISDQYDEPDESFLPPYTRIAYSSYNFYRLYLSVFAYLDTQGKNNIGSLQVVKVGYTPYVVKMEPCQEMAAHICNYYLKNKSTLDKKQQQLAGRYFQKHLNL